jgi:hypothetical protein
VGLLANEGRGLYFRFDGTSLPLVQKLGLVNRRMYVCLELVNLLEDEVGIGSETAQRAVHGLPKLSPQNRSIVGNSAPQTKMAARTFCLWTQLWMGVRISLLNIGGEGLRRSV